MKDFTTRVETHDQELHIHLPDDFVLGAYEVIVSKIVEAETTIEPAQESWSSYVDTLKLSLPPDGWIFK
jgi:virulence-associated protein VagC